MIDKIIETLEAIGYPAYLQGTLLPEESYPESFFTVWNNASTGTSFYNNREYGVIWDYSVTIYSTSPTIVNSALLEAKRALKAEGFTVSGAGYDIPSDIDTHTGRTITAYFREVMKGENT